MDQDHADERRYQLEAALQDEDEETLISLQPTPCIVDGEPL
jgi:hypothetical protein